jgi:hypothetical protein
MNILFLDIDGVLNSLASVVAIGQSYPAKDVQTVTLDPVAVGLLKAMCKECDFHIYVHSTWSQGRDTQYFQELFEYYGFKATILDRVHDSDHRVSRIRQAMDHYKPERCIILDDDTICDKLGDCFIHVDNRNGLRWEHYEKVLMRFGKSVPIILM